MRLGRRLSIGALVFSLFVVSCPTAAWAISGTGTPSVQLDTDPTEPEKGFYSSISNIAPAVNQALSATPIEFDVMLTDMQHLHIFDSDAGDFGGMEAGFDELAMDINVSNTSSSAAGNMDLVLDFLDMNGAVITPAALDSNEFGNHVSFTIDPSSGLLGFGRLFRAELMSGLKFHAVRVSLTGDTNLLWNTLSSVEIRKIDPTSVVGVWVPEPGAGMIALTTALWTIGARGRVARSDPRRLGHTRRRAL
jgi:hypothetical protein